ncbi:MAG: VanZ family protein [Azonexaceae bacterium]|nr:VanZ family protein [Azonexaceae bacterium]
MNRGDDQTDRAATTRLLSVLATLYLFFVFYGSWVPFHFVSLPFAEALKTFAALPFSEQTIDSATDWAINFILLIPLAFLWAQRFLPARQGLSRLIYRLLIIGISVAIAFFLEFSQLYFPPRTVSQKDILALSMGAFVGVVAQQRLGGYVERWLSQLWQNERGQTRLIQLLHVYLLIFFVFSVMPLDLTISLVEIYHKWSEGRVVLLPFGGLKGGLFDNIYETITDLLVWVPVGLLLALDRRSSLIRVAGVAWLAAAIIEVAQLLVYSRVTDVTDVFLAGFGAGIGALLAYRGAKIVIFFSSLGTVHWFSIWMLWALGVFCVFWYPFDFQTKNVSLESAWMAFTRIPFLMLFEGSELNAINEMLRKIAFFVPGGTIWCLGMAAFRKNDRITGSKTTGIFALVSVAIAVETGQLFIPGKFADLTDVLLETVGALTGMLAGAWVLSAYQVRKEFVKYTFSERKDNYFSLGRVCFLFGILSGKITSLHFSQMRYFSPFTNKHFVLDFLPLAFAALGLVVLIGRENLLGMPALYFVIPIVGIIASAFSSRCPEFAIISYLVISYAFPRYSNESIFILKAGVLNWICLIGLIGWIVGSTWRSCILQWKHPVSLVFFAFLFVLALSWAVAASSNTFRDIDIFPRHTPLLFLHALVLFLMASSLPVRNKSLVIWGLILCTLPSFRWFLQGSEGIYLDNDISSFSTLLMPIALVGAWYVQRILVRILFFASAVAMLGIIGFAQNRASAISLTLGFVFLLWSEFKRQKMEISKKNSGTFIGRLSGLSFVSGLTLKRFLLPAVILLILSLSYALLPLKEYQARFSVLWNPEATHATVALDRATINERYELWSGGIEMAFDHPILGVGPGNYANLIGIYQIGKSKLPAHNSFISVAAEAGFFALALFLTLIYMGFRTLGQISRQSRILAFQGTAIALQASIIAFIAISIFMSRHDLVFLYVVLGLVVALSVALKTDRMSNDARFLEGRGYLCVQAPKPAQAPPKLAETKATTQAEIVHLGGLDGLRAIAALSVFGVHFNQIAGLDTSIGPFDLGRWLANGNTGVALFFVLSGFLLSLPFWRQEHAAGSKVDVKSYFFRRLARILPAYYLCLFGLLVIKEGTGSIFEIDNILSHVVFLYNINDRNILSLNAPFWSLAVEMQFYLLLPLLMFALNGLSARVSFVLLTVLVVGTYCSNYGVMSYLLERNQWPIQMTLIWPFSLYISGPDSFVLTYSLLAHLSFFLIGVATALVFVTRGRGDKVLANQTPGLLADLVFWSSATAVFLILSSDLDDVLQAPYGHYNWPFVPLLFAAMILVMPRAKHAKALLESRPLRWLGVISYGFYIFHFPIQTFVVRLFDHAGLAMTDFWWLFAVLSLSASVVVAAVSYWLLELPVIRWARGYQVWQPDRAHQVKLAEKGFVSKSDGKEASPRYSSGGDWTEVKVRFHSRQLETLKRVSHMQGLSVSAAARHLLAAYMVDSGEFWTQAQVLTGVDQDLDDGAGENCSVNMHFRQYEFLLEAADRIGSTIDAVFGLMIDYYSKAPVSSDQIGSTYDSQ